MPFPFVLSYARKDRIIKTSDPPEFDPHFEAFLARLNKRVSHFTGTDGYLDTNIEPGQEWHDELAEALRTAHTLVCLYSPAYFLSENCGKEMQVFLERRAAYIRKNGGKKPANIIPVVWQRLQKKIPKALPDIEYKDIKLDAETRGVWDLADDGLAKEVNDIADQIAVRVSNAAELTPLSPLAVRPSLYATRSAFVPSLPLPEFDAVEAKVGPNAVTFLYASSTRWEDWPWTPPREHAVLYIAAAVAKGREMHSTQFVFSLTDANFPNRLNELRAKNNVVILFVDAATMHLDDLKARLREFDQSDQSLFAMIAMIDNGPGLRANVEQVVPQFARRAPPYFQVFETSGSFNVESREAFSKVIESTLEELKLAVVRDSQARGAPVLRTSFQSLPTISGPGRVSP